MKGEGELNGEFIENNSQHMKELPSENAKSKSSQRSLEEPQKNSQSSKSKQSNSLSRNEETASNHLIEIDKGEIAVT